MKIRQEIKEDPLSQYINPEEIEKAPEGFTDKLMMLIRMEAGPAKSLFTEKKRFIVPVIAATITASLILFAILFPGNDTSLPLFSWLKYLDNINITIPEIQQLTVFNTPFPGILLYVTAGVFLLLILDRALSWYFHKEIKQ